MSRVLELFWAFVDIEIDSDCDLWLMHALQAVFQGFVEFVAMSGSSEATIYWPMSTSWSNAMESSCHTLHSSSIISDGALNQIRTPHA